VVDAPEILAVIGKVPHLSEFLNSLYNCQYKSFFVAFCKFRYLNNLSILLQYYKITVGIFVARIDMVYNYFQLV
jgi:hypothetical protein